MLLLYFVALVLFFSRTHHGVVDVMVMLVFFYGTPLGIFLVVYIAILAAAIYVLMKYAVSWDWWKLISISARLAVATLPMFYLDEEMAKLLVYLRELG